MSSERHVQAELARAACMRMRLIITPHVHATRCLGPLLGHPAYCVGRQLLESRPAKGVFGEDKNQHKRATPVSGIAGGSS